MKWLVFLIFLISACDNGVRFLGYPKVEDVPNIIKIGDDMDFVYSSLGSPSLKSDDGLTWYYIRINGRLGNIVSFVPNQKIMCLVRFSDSQKVNGIEILKSKMQDSYKYKKPGNIKDYKYID